MRGFAVKMIRSIRYSIILAILVLPPDIILRNIQAHSRWGCPQPRDPDPGIKDGPCGTISTLSSMMVMNETIMVLQPGPMLVRWEEAVSHTGSPFRISLSGDHNDSEACVLLDHIPHNDDSDPNSNVESTYTNYSMIIDVPNVACERCSFHLANPMTDKEGLKGNPTGKGCTDPLGDCLVVYHSCTIPFRINGTIPRVEYQCPNRNPIDWPTAWIGDYGITVNASQMGVYRRESGTWTNSFLTNVPPRYRTVNDNVILCENITTQHPSKEGQHIFFSRFISRLFKRIFHWLDFNG